MNSFRQFNKLTFEDKSIQIEFKGIYLISVERGFMNVHLYSLDNFFVEMWTIDGPVDNIIKVIGFRRTGLLFSYLNEIKINRSGLTLK